MNDAPVLTGLARQLVLAEIIDEKTALIAAQQAQRNNIPLVTYLVQNKLANSRQIAAQAAEQFGVPHMDLASLDREAQPKELISEKLARKHRVIPLWKRGNKLFIGVSDPTNHQVITDIQFSTGLNTEVVLVEDDPAVRLLVLNRDRLDAMETGLARLGGLAKAALTLAGGVHPRLQTQQRHLPLTAQLGRHILARQLAGAVMAAAALGAALPFASTIAA